MELTLLRHGQGTHNRAAYDHGIGVYLDAAYHDAPLNEMGREQCLGAGQALAGLGLLQAFDLVLVSPLTRALQTATLVFSSSEGAAPPMEACELIREAYGLHHCDSRSSLSLLVPQYPHVSFGSVETDLDEWHSPHARETLQSVTLRCKAFLELLARQYSGSRRVLVVSHGVFLECLCKLIPGAEQGEFLNCELRTVRIASQAPLPPPGLSLATPSPLPLAMHTPSGGAHPPGPLPQGPTFSL
jgi:broad specificity phosphatase PhoE